MITDEMIVRLRIDECTAWAAYQSHVHNHGMRSCCEDALAEWSRAQTQLNRALSMREMFDGHVVEA